jgi:hypothetical protein
MAVTAHRSCLKANSRFGESFLREPGGPGSREFCGHAHRVGLRLKNVPILEPGVQPLPASLSASPNEPRWLLSVFDRRVFGFDGACLRVSSRFALSRAVCALAIACSRRCRSFAFAASSFHRSIWGCLSVRSYPKAARPAAFSSVSPGGGFFDFAMPFRPATHVAG